MFANFLTAAAAAAAAFALTFTIFGLIEQSTSLKNGASSSSAK